MSSTFMLCPDCDEPVRKTRLFVYNIDPTKTTHHHCTKPIKPAETEASVRRSYRHNNRRDA